MKAAAVALAAVLTVGSAGCTEATRSAGAQSSEPERLSPPTPPPIPEPDPVVSKRLAALPERCPGPRLRRRVVHRDYAPLFGKPPIFAGVYATYEPGSNGFVADRGTPRTELGWRNKVLWVMENESTSVVTVSARNRQTGEPVVFEVEEGPTVEARFDPASPGHPAQNPKTTEWGSYVYFPSAGCYVFEARAGNSAWRWGFGYGAGAPVFNRSFNIANARLDQYERVAYHPRRAELRSATRGWGGTCGHACGRERRAGSGCSPPSSARVALLPPRSLTSSRAILGPTGVGTS